MREEIQKIATDRKIPFLVHFTRVENVQSIMQNGLLPISKARDMGITPAVNDEKRLDGRLNGTSLSIAFPNGSLFFKLRNNFQDIDWVVLAIHSSVLWSKKTLFCKHNAADSSISGISDDILQSAEAFNSMFNEIEGFDTRAEQGLKVHDPTDVQAEVLVMDSIEPEFILGGLFNNNIVRDNYSKYFGKRKLLVHEGKKGVFANRTYYRKFGQG